MRNTEQVPAVSTQSTSKIVGGAGAQGMPIVEGLVADGKYSARVLTRNPHFAQAEALAGKGSLFERVRPDEWANQVPVIKAVADGRRGKL